MVTLRQDVEGGQQLLNSIFGVITCHILLHNYVVGSKSNFRKEEMRKKQGNHFRMQKSRHERLDLLVSFRNDIKTLTRCIINLF